MYTSRATILLRVRPFCYCTAWLKINTAAGSSVSLLGHTAFISNKKINSQAVRIISHLSQSYRILISPHALISVEIDLTLECLPKNPRATGSYRDWEKSQFRTGKSTKGNRCIKQENILFAFSVSVFPGRIAFFLLPHNCIGNSCMLVTLEEHAKNHQKVYSKQLQCKSLGEKKQRERKHQKSNRKTSLVFCLLISVIDTRNKGDRKFVSIIFWWIYCVCCN